jgi:hypothetical protein
VHRNFRYRTLYHHRRLPQEEHRRRGDMGQDAAAVSVNVSVANRAPWRNRLNRPIWIPIPFSRLRSIVAIACRAPCALLYPKLYAVVNSNLPTPQLEIGQSLEQIVQYGREWRHFVRGLGFTVEVFAELSINESESLLELIVHAL